MCRLCGLQKYLLKITTVDTGNKQAFILFNVKKVESLKILDTDT